MSPIELLTLGLVLFAAAQVIVQVRTERLRQTERTADLDEALDQAFQYAWAEHFRFESLADVLQRSDLIELATLDLLRPEDVRLTDPVHLLRSLSMSGREAGVLGGILLGASVDVQRTVGIFVGSVKAFARSAPASMTEAEKVQWIRTEHGEDLEPWEKATRDLVKEIALLMWDAVKHSPRAAINRELHFSDDLSSRMAQAAVRSIVSRSVPDGSTS